MSSKVIELENVSKLYRIGAISQLTLRQDIVRWWRNNIQKKEASSDKPDNTGSMPDYLWALKNINLEVREGDVLGIIGNNGAGKSTLLKILSKVTRPTKGIVKGRGRIISLLEVGTGFHDELTGRENIFLNGNILGMTNREISSRLDEIISFSGVERYIDTPVKRYSSGMYVRLAFAVAAHLEPEILIIDEVLAVGDAEFQKKCLGKMRQASQNQGRTVLFVSHNMQAIQNLCKKVVLLQNGNIAAAGRPAEVVNKYLNGNVKQNLMQKWTDTAKAPGNEYIMMRGVQLEPHFLNGGDLIDVRTPLTVHFKFDNLTEAEICVGVHVFTATGECIFDVCSVPEILLKGTVKGECRIPGHFLNDGAYYVSIIFVKDTSVQLYYLEECLHFEVHDYRENMFWYGKWIGYVRPNFPVTLQPV